MLGLKRHTVRLCSHNEAWKAAFLQAKKEIEQLISDHIIDIEHIGSTAITGIKAKPILDIGILINNFDQLKHCIDQLKLIGFEYRGDAGNEGGHVLVKNEPGEIRTHHIHIIEIQDKQWDNYLSFRDHLNAHPEIALEYSELKSEMAIKYSIDRRAYTKSKTLFIEKIINSISG